MSKDTNTHDEYAAVTERESSTDYYRESYADDPTKNPKLLQLQKLNQKIRNINDEIEKLLHEFDKVIADLTHFLSVNDFHGMEDVWFHYQNLRVRRESIIDEIKKTLPESNIKMIKPFEMRYDEKENVFYKIVCQKIVDEYHAGGGMKNCMYLHEKPVSYLYKKLVESGRSLWKFINPSSGYYSAINSCLKITPPKQSLKESFSKTGSQLRYYFKGESVKPFEHGGKKITKNKLRKKGRKVTKRRKTVKRRKTTKK